MLGSQSGPEWWKTFNDGRLDQLVEQALANNIDIAVASVRVAEARARNGHRTVSGWRVPSDYLMS